MFLGRAGVILLGAVALSGFSVGSPWYFLWCLWLVWVVYGLSLLLLVVFGITRIVFGPNQSLLVRFMFYHCLENLGGVGVVVRKYSCDVSFFFIIQHALSVPIPRQVYGHKP